MAQRRSGFFSKFMNVLGIVDEDPQQGYNNGYDRYDGYDRGGRPSGSTYVPSQQRSRMQATRQPSTVDSRYGSTREDYGEGYTVRRTQRAYDQQPQSQQQATPRRQPEQPRRESAFVGRPIASRGGQQQPANPPARPAGAARTIMCPITSLEECRDVIDVLVENNIVLLMLDEMDPALTQRVVDLLSGAAFALHATIKKASDRTYLIAPRTVGVSDNDELMRRY